tara:strand:- start:829 stop:942 length:114 start_codon:yes stop_codon:yes gene_type:complete
MIGKILEITVWIIITGLTGFGLLGLIAAMSEGNHPLE